MRIVLGTGQVCAFREYDQKSGWRQPVPPAKAREPYDNEVVKRWCESPVRIAVTVSNAKMDCEL